MSSSNTNKKNLNWRSNNNTKKDKEIKDSTTITNTDDSLFSKNINSVIENKITETSSNKVNKNSNSNNNNNNKAYSNNKSNFVANSTFYNNPYKQLRKNLLWINKDTKIPSEEKLWYLLFKVDIEEPKTIEEAATEEENKIVATFKNNDYIQGPFASTELTCYLNSIQVVETDLDNIFIRPTDFYKYEGKNPSELVSLTEMSDPNCVLKLKGVQSRLDKELLDHLYEQIDSFRKESSLIIKSIKKSREDKNFYDHLTGEEKEIWNKLNKNSNSESTDPANTSTQREVCTVNDNNKPSNYTNNKYSEKTSVIFHDNIEIKVISRIVREGIQEKVDIKIMANNKDGLVLDNDQLKTKMLLPYKHETGYVNDDTEKIMSSEVLKNDVDVDIDDILQNIEEIDNSNKKNKKVPQLYNVNAANNTKAKKNKKKKTNSKETANTKSNIIKDFFKPEENDSDNDTNILNTNNKIETKKKNINIVDDDDTENWITVGKTNNTVNANTANNININTLNTNYNNDIVNTDLKSVVKTNITDPNLAEELKRASQKANMQDKHDLYVKNNEFLKKNPNKIQVGFNYDDDKDFVVVKNNKMKKK